MEIVVLVSFALNIVCCHAGDYVSIITPGNNGRFTCDNTTTILHKNSIRLFAVDNSGRDLTPCFCYIAREQSQPMTSFYDYTGKVTVQSGGQFQEQLSIHCSYRLCPLEVFYLHSVSTDMTEFVINYNQTTWKTTESKTRVVFQPAIPKVICSPFGYPDLPSTPISSTQSGTPVPSSTQSSTHNGHPTVLSTQPSTQTLHEASTKVLTSKVPNLTVLNSVPPRIQDGGANVGLIIRCVTGVSASVTVFIVTVLVISCIKKNNSRLEGNESSSRKESRNGDSIDRKKDDNTVQYADINLDLLVKNSTKPTIPSMTRSPSEEDVTYIQLHFKP